MTTLQINGCLMERQVMPAYQVDKLNSQHLTSLKFRETYNNI
jgi:hypothetical protein